MGWFNFYVVGDGLFWFSIEREGDIQMSVKKKIKKSVKRTVKAGKEAARIASLTAVAMVAYPIAMKLVNEDDD